MASIMGLVCVVSVTDYAKVNKGRITSLLSENNRYY